MDDITTRAMAAYFRAHRNEHNPNQPANTSGLRTHDGKDYVVLENTNGPLAVYRVRNDGKLKQLRRWPAGLVDES